MNRCILVTGVFLFLLSAGLFASDIDKYYAKKEYISPRRDTLRYRVLEPERIEKNKKYPLVLFLHGAGERGSDNEAQLVHGANMFLNLVIRDQHPTFVIYPQCPSECSWSNSSKPNSEGKSGGERFPENPEITIPMEAVKAVLDMYMNNDNVDVNRIYVMGLSMGGMGTFDLLCRFPDLFAAAIPICGGINPERLEKASPTTAITIYHGDKDDAVFVENSRAAYRALKKIGKIPRYIEFPGCGHNSWDPAFNQPDFLEWLFRQSK